MRLFWENCKRVYRDYMLITYKIYMKYTCIVKVRLYRSLKQIVWRLTQVIAYTTLSSTGNTSVYMLLIKVASISIYFLKIHHYVGYFVNQLPNFSKYLFTFSITNYKREKQTLIMLMFISNNILSTV